jgi:glutathione synthase
LYVAVMPARIAIQMDPPERLNPALDSTLFLALEAQIRGHLISWFHPSELATTEHSVFAPLKPLTVHDRLEHFYESGAPTSTNLETVDIVLIRQDPPFHMGYLSTTWLLERLKNPRILNNPTAIRNHPEKLFPLDFPEFLPPTRIAADAQAIRAFHREQGEIVLKPLYGFGGHGIFKIGRDGGNLDSLLETLLGVPTPEPLVAQRFLPQVTAEEKRILLINGEIAAAFGRIPQQGDIRSNMRVGGQAVETTLTPRQKDAAAAIGATCAREGLMLAGLDMIGDHVIEINITCPTGLRAAQKLLGVNLAQTFWDAVEQTV